MTQTELLLLDSVPDGLLLVNMHGDIKFANQQAETIFGYSKDALQDMVVEDLIPHHLHDKHVELRRQYELKPFVCEMGQGSTRHGLHRDGHLIPVEIRLSPLRRDSSPLIICSVRDVTDKRRLQLQIKSSEQRHRSLYDNNPQLLFSLSAEGSVLGCNRAAARSLGQDADDLVGRSFVSLVGTASREKVRLALRNSALQPGLSEHCQLSLHAAKNTLVVCKATISCVPVSPSNQEILVVCEDVSEIYHLSRRLEYQAQYDALTGLINRREFEQRLQYLLDTRQHHQQDVVLAYLNVDNFRVINELCGHVAGDSLLRYLSTLFRNRLRRNDSVARLSGDEFCFIFVDCDCARAEAIFSNLFDQISSQAFKWHGKSFNISARAGLLPVLEDLKSVSTALVLCEEACERALKKGGGNICIADPGMSSVSSHTEEMNKLVIIQQALAGNTFELYQQPIFSLKGGDCHHELLVRIRLETGELLVPGEFLPVAERFGLSMRIDAWVVQNAINWICAQPWFGNPDYRFAINLSGQSISDREFLQMTSDRVESSHIPDGCLCFEVTETVAISDLQSAQHFIETLHQCGCTFALDDFGTGFSSFSYLRALPVDFIKIDGQFVREARNNPVDQAMLISINQVAQVMNISTIAEFVEDHQTMLLLGELGIDYAQGYLLGKPSPLDDLTVNPAQQTASLKHKSATEQHDTRQSNE